MVIISSAKMARTFESWMKKLGTKQRYGSTMKRVQMELKSIKLAESVEPHHLSFSQLITVSLVRTIVRRIGEGEQGTNHTQSDPER